MSRVLSLSYCVPARIQYSSFGYFFSDITSSTALFPTNELNTTFVYLIFSDLFSVVVLF